MNKMKISVIGHRNLNICNPISAAKLDQAIALVSLNPNSNVVDFGSGKCEFLIRLIEKYNVTGVGVELDGGVISDVEKVIQGRISRDKLQIHLGDAKDFLSKAKCAELDFGICIGSTHAFGGLVPTLKVLHERVKTGGYVLIGEGYWKRKPEQGYLDFLGDSEEQLITHEENIGAAEAAGMVPLWAVTANDDDWDAYEWSYSRSIETYVFEHSDDPDCEEMLARIRSWRKAYLRWGRSTLGFGLYLFRNMKR
jgi:cyclopropane fatty-acyl-phospholipid synthase-like methyltransferase